MPTKGTAFVEDYYLLGKRETVECADVAAIAGFIKSEAANEAKLALEPVPVYISRATQKLYVRRYTHKPLPDGGEVFDATIEVPVTIRNPNKPIGTHGFTAVTRNGATAFDTSTALRLRSPSSTMPEGIVSRLFRR